MSDDVTNATKSSTNGICSEKNISVHDLMTMSSLSRHQILVEITWDQFRKLAVSLRTHAVKDYPVTSSNLWRDIAEAAISKGQYFNDEK